MYIELAISILDMTRDGVLGDAEPLGCLRVTAADRQQAQHVQFACSELGPVHTGHFRNCGNPVASHGTKVTSSTTIAEKMSSTHRETSRNRLRASRNTQREWTAPVTQSTARSGMRPSTR